jgi:hypothetical protein
MSDSANAAPPEEIPFFSERGVQVTTKRFINGAYSIDLDKVKTTDVLREKPRTGLALLGAIACAPLTLFALMLSALDGKAAVWALVFASLTIWSLSRAFRARKFTLELHTAGEINRDLVSTDEDFIDRVNAAIAKAQSTSVLPAREA